MFEVGTRIRTTRVNFNDVEPLWKVGDTGTITFLGWGGDSWANVQFDNVLNEGCAIEDIVNFDEMEVISPFDAVDDNDELVEDQPFCQAEPDDGGTLCELANGHGGAHKFGGR